MGRHYNFTTFAQRGQCQKESDIPIRPCSLHQEKHGSLHSFFTCVHYSPNLVLTRDCCTYTLASGPDILARKSCIWVAPFQGAWLSCSRFSVYICRQHSPEKMKCRIGKFWLGERKRTCQLGASGLGWEGHGIQSETEETLMRNQRHRRLPLFVHLYVWREVILSLGCSQESPKELLKFLLKLPQSGNQTSVFLNAHKAVWCPAKSDNHWFMAN